MNTAMRRCGIGIREIRLANPQEKPLEVGIGGLIIDIERLWRACHFPSLILLEAIHV